MRYLSMILVLALAAGSLTVPVAAFSVARAGAAHAQMY